MSALLGYALTFLIVLILLSGCIPDIEKLCSHQQSACFNVTTVYGTVRGACSGLLNGTVTCDENGKMSIRAAQPTETKQ